MSQIYEAAERAGILERTTFVITGDHGHVDLHTKIAPNVWLAAAGLLESAPASGTAGRGDWRAVFHVTGASAFLHLADPEDRTTRGGRESRSLLHNVHQTWLDCILAGSAHL